MAKVTCSLCSYEDTNFCNKKKTTVKTNKPRKCDVYQYDSAKLIKKNDILLQRHKKRYSNIKSKIEKNMSKQQNPILSTPHSMVDTSSVPIQYGTTNPITGDLSRFTSSARKG